MDEFLYELREHSAGLNCGRWDYIFSLIKTLRELPGAVVPDRGAVGMTQHCMRSYSLLLIKTCHRRGVHAMGGMAAQIPIKGDDAANAAALAKVKADKLRVRVFFFFRFFVFEVGRGGPARKNKQTNKQLTLFSPSLSPLFLQTKKKKTIHLFDRRTRTATTAPGSPTRPSSPSPAPSSTRRGPRPTRSAPGRASTSRSPRRTC